ncbi:MAG: bifunctional riboflavin kinase/FAD synthetase [Thermodesulfobacteriota bacterium]
MEIIKGIENLTRPLRNPVITLGNFDGVHLGHQKIFKRVLEEAQRINGEGIVITFEPHPLRVLNPERFLPLLSPFRKKMFLIEATGIQTVLCLEFSLNFSKLSASEFIEKILVNQINVKKVIIGYNYHFGNQKGGDVETLIRDGKRFGFDVEVVEGVKINQTPVSSSRIRELLQKGMVEEASILLGRDYPVIGNVIKGTGRGKDLGFPTANLERSEELYPKTGVYAVEVIWREKHFDGVANVGTNPTFNPLGEKRGDLTLEVYILNLDQDLYGEEIQVNFKRRIRDEIRFNSSQELVDQIKKDVLWAKENVFSGKKP